MAVKLTFFGAVRTVTGSLHLIDTGSSRIILDCGLYQGRRRESRQRNENPPIPPALPQALILSHAHIDHCGNIPTFVKLGYKGPIHATFATRDLCTAMLRDSAHIQEKDAEYLNKKLARRGEEPITPLYRMEDAERSLKLFRGYNYRQPFYPTPDICITFYDAGHVLGSALTCIEVDNGKKPLRIGYIVDLGRRNLPILRDPEIIQGLDYMIIESTYGNRTHTPIEQARDELRDVVRRTVERGGKIIIPAFALERTQELVYCLHELWEAGEIPEIPIFVDSPLAVNVTEIFRMHPECFDEETNRYLLQNEDPFGFGRLQYIRDVEDSKALNYDTRPMIIISASGMCESGRILHHLKNNIENSKNTILIVGFMAQNTLGKRLVDRVGRVKIFGEEYRLKAEVVVMNSFSAHADKEDLLNYVKKSASARLKGIFIVHGDEDQSLALREHLHDAGFENAYVPQPGDVAELT